MIDHLKKKKIKVTRAFLISKEAADVLQAPHFIAEGLKVSSDKNKARDDEQVRKKTRFKSNLNLHVLPQFREKHHLAARWAPTSLPAPLPRPSPPTAHLILIFQRG